MGEVDVSLEIKLMQNFIDVGLKMLGILDWKFLDSANTTHFITKRIRNILRDILLNKSTEYWRYEQTFLILLKLSSKINPFKKIRENISKNWEKIISSILKVWDIKYKDNGLELLKNNSILIDINYETIDSVDARALLYIRIGGTIFSLFDAVKLFTIDSELYNKDIKVLLPCGRFMSPELIVSNIPGNERCTAENTDPSTSNLDIDISVDFWIDVFKTFYGRIPSVFRFSYILPEYAQSLLKSYKVIMEDSRHGALSIPWRHFIGILSAALYKNDYMVKLEMQMFLINKGSVEWLTKGTNSLPCKLQNLTEFINFLAFDPANIPYDIMNGLLGVRSGIQGWTITELCHVLCVVTTIQSMSQLASAFGLTSMDHWDLGCDPLEGLECDGDTRYKPIPEYKIEVSIYENSTVYSSSEVPKKFNLISGDNSSYYNQLLAEYVDLTNLLNNKCEPECSTNKNDNILIYNIKKSEISNTLSHIFPWFSFNFLSSVLERFNKESLSKIFLTSGNNQDKNNIKSNNALPCKSLVSIPVYSKSQNIFEKPFESKVCDSDFYLNSENNIIQSKPNKNHIGIDSSKLETDSIEICNIYEKSFDHLIRLLERFPPQGDIDSISRDQISQFRSNTARYKTDKFLLASVMQAKPSHTFEPLSMRFILSTKVQSEDLSHDSINTANSHKFVNKKKCNSWNHTPLSIPARFSIQTQDYEFYSDTAWTILSTYSYDASICIKNELDTVLFICGNKMNTIQDKFKVPTTNPIRSALWNYVFKLCGITKSDAFETIYNSFLPVGLKILLKKVICFPHKILRSDFERCRTTFSYRELIYFIIVACKAKQAATTTCAIQVIAQIMKV
ncbi:uncharacterized protein CMU_037110 [Cryptosporidium muris RN66]|uniref:Uncharacterized protein n=1 Tax=Cryptosporidium muris (strain RN66) TaxID=441375 RepID=B6AH46_CRYMR|nr:uncharacterized protein CMU_037110 [Cryptosporidium muris RN66]EEA07537.1 hypothetical protein, conserved [Cryptosporidium muris RN66]|eukprot:XP_002141886.1 hypothetical protein [Cryptosporidium muris RN66]